MSRFTTLEGDRVFWLHDAGEALSDRILKDADYFERDILDYLKENYPAQKTIIDVGANIGNHTVYFAQNFTYDSIVSFEPIPANFVLLEQNITGLNNVFLRREAVGDTSADIMMRENRGNMGACEVDPEGDVSVHQVRLGDIFVPEVSLVKIDVEWYELQVLEGAKELLKEDKPLILIEDSSVAYEDYLKDLNYKIQTAWPEHKTYLYHPV
jgi:FkbM family methyltransferase